MMAMCRSEDSFGYQSSPSHLVEDRISLLFATMFTRLADSRAPRDSLVSTPHLTIGPLGLQGLHAFWGPKLKLTCLHSKYFIRWAISLDLTSFFLQTHLGTGRLIDLPNTQELETDWARSQTLRISFPKSTHRKSMLEWGQKIESDFKEQGGPSLSIFVEHMVTAMVCSWNIPPQAHLLTALFPAGSAIGEVIETLVGRTSLEKVGYLGHIPRWCVSF